MQEVLQVIIKYGFEEMKLRFIEGEVDPSNIKSIKLMEKNGFVFNKRLENTEIYFVQNPIIKRKMESNPIKFLFASLLTNFKYEL